MRKVKILMAVVVAATILASLSCSKEIYNEETHHEIIRYLSPVDSVDQQHTWTLTENHTYTVSANANVGASRLEIYSGNPVESSEAEMMARVFVRDGQQVTLNVSMPAILSTVYAVLVDAEGYMTVTSFSKNTRNVDFSNLIAKKQKPALLTPRIMAYTYCFEENFPEPGDYDYNDVVMRVALERTGQKTIDIHTTLSAVGADKMLSGAIRLVGYRYQDIDSVVAKNGKTFNEKAPSTVYELFSNDDLLQKGRNGEAVLNIFLDAHWAMGDDLPEINGDFPRYKYNVSRSYSDAYEITYAKNITYTVYFKSETGLNNFSFDMIDPFLMTFYSGSRLEIHLDEFASAQTMYTYNTISFKDLPWALKIPTRYFKYPLEGNQIGFRKEGFMFGAYMTVGHGFGEWCEDHRNYLDWYLYPTENQVF